MRDLSKYQVPKFLETFVFWVVAPCNLVEIYRCLRGAVASIIHYTVPTTQDIAIFILAAERT
jgi:hypothetical protein